MKLLPSLLALVAFLALAILGASAAPPSAERIVVMISVDGLANFYFDDPKAEMPTIRQLAAEGARADGMKASLPTVTWPNHTTLVTGVSPSQHGVVGNNFFDRAAGRTIALIADPLLDKDQIVKVPTVYDLAKAYGLTTAAVRWPASRNAKSLDWTTPDVHSGNLVRQFTTPEVLQTCEAEGIHLDQVASPDDPLGDMFESRDALWTHVFLDILRRHRPNLALLHITDVDHVEHVDGPRSREAYAAIKRADDQVRLVWDHLQKDFPGQATIVVVSDHGFSPIKRIVLPNVVLSQAGLAKIAAEQVVGGQAQGVSQGGAGFIYVTDDANRAEVIEKVRQAFVGIEGVAKIIGVDQFKEYGVADPQVDPHAPDLILLAEMGYVFGDTAAGELPFEEKPERKGSHGHDPNYPDLRAMFVAAGAGIRPGVRLDTIANTSVAPTIARLLGFTIPGAEGKPLDAALTPESANLPLAPRP